MNDAAAAPSRTGDTAVLDVEQSVSGRFWRQRHADDRTALALSQRLGVPDI
ncbi:MAG: hypothetical protein HOC44_00030, partial [Rhodospirillaceae bacterium]|nr:hypothetical protein [Rhodospirillaceae bacterium]